MELNLYLSSAFQKQSLLIDGRSAFELISFQLHSYLPLLPINHANPSQYHLQIELYLHQDCHPFLFE